MGGFRRPSVVMAAAVVAYQTTDASQHQNLRHRNLQTRDYEYVGCFKDDGGDRLLEIEMTDSENQTADFCYDYCRDLGAPLMATQWGIECWCADEEVKVDLERHGEGAECDYPCAGDEDEMCGGYYALDLYRIGSGSRRDYEYVGCFKDDAEDRLLGIKMIDDENQTADFCYAYCRDLGAPLMATQWGIECWCADEEVEGDFERHGEGAKCDSPCAGDQDEICGGRYAVDLYRIGSGRSESTSSPVDGALVSDIVEIKDVEGLNPGGAGWADSYSVGDRCYMASNFDHGIGGYTVDTPKGSMTIKDLFDELEPGPGADSRPLYNDIQCGNGPANDAGDETDCPGLVEYGRAGCGQVGPMWDLSELE